MQRGEPEGRDGVLPRSFPGGGELIHDCRLRTLSFWAPEKLDVVLVADILTDGVDPAVVGRNSAAQHSARRGRD